jgi:low density lipoprotein-related protein 2
MSRCGTERFCYNSTKRCDGIFDCPGQSGADEANCRQQTPTIQRTCNENQFQCSPSISVERGGSSAVTCIPKAWVCDGHIDCDSGLDEQQSCPRINCTSNYFTCSNLKCVPNAWICDGEDDCGDSSDEKNCPALPHACQSHEFKCLGTMEVCINQTQVCDNIRNCPDGSDEGGFCSRDDCSTLNGGCSHYCHRSPIGSVCYCPSGYRTTNETMYKKCQDINECDDEEVGSLKCSQKCANTPSYYNCACEQGYVRASRVPYICKAITRSNAKVYVTNGANLLITNLDGTQMKSLRNVASMRRLTAFDFHNRTGRIYWADRELKSIYSSFETGTDVRQIVSSGIGLVESLAVDWIGQNLYWADYILQHIEVSKLDGKRRTILFNVSKTLTKNCHS